MNTIELSAVDYPFGQNTHIREVRISLPDGTHMRSALGLKDNRVARPFVIVACGLDCNLGDAITSIAIAHFFDASPFNVLVLPSTSGSQFIEDNDSYKIAGVEEGRLLLQVADLVGSVASSLKPLISSLHVAGFSFGGHAALYASLYQSLRPTNFDPIVTSNFWPPFRGEEIKSAEDFWELNRFDKFAGLINVPTLIWAAANDPIVKAAANYDLLMAIKAKNPQAALGQVEAVESRLGSHCAFSKSYGWDFTSAVLRGSVLGFSPEFREKARDQSLKFSQLTSDTNQLALLPGERYFGYRWTVREGEKNLRLDVKIFSPTRDLGITQKCGATNPYKTFDGCFKLVQITVPVDRFANSDLMVPTNRIEAQAATRWANTNLTLRKQDGSSWVDDTFLPDQVTWESFE